MKILNLYAGVGGNRKLWGDEHEITAIEYNENIAEVYKDLFPNDKMIIGDAHEYLLNHYHEFDFIWSSPPCPTHSDIRRCGVHAGRYEAKYPDMKLYEEIILLKNFAKKETKWVVENVKPYYKYLITPSAIIQRHPFWTNFVVSNFDKKDDRNHNEIKGGGDVYGFNIKNTNITDKRKSLRNLVNPELGLHLLKESQSKEFSFFRGGNGS